MLSPSPMVGRGIAGEYKLLILDCENKSVEMKNK
jgi:hypothetical protein